MQSLVERRPTHAGRDGPCIGLYVKAVTPEREPSCRLQNGAGNRKGGGGAPSTARPGSAQPDSRFRGAVPGPSSLRVGLLYRQDRSQEGQHQLWAAAPSACDCQRGQ
jgi:hypothetical protein